MTYSITRRAFGGLLVAAGLAPRLGFAQSSTYAHPELLMDVDVLAAIIGEDGQQLQSSDHGHLAIVDVRPAEDYILAHIPGALHLDPNAVVAEGSPVDGSLRSESEIAGMLGALGLDAQTRIVFYDDRGGFHAARMFWLLEYLGHRNVALLNGGLTAWQNAGGGMSTELPISTQRVFGIAPMPRRLATADYLLQMRDDPQSIVVDVRPEHMYAEGHIPWAINVPWARNLDEDKLFLPADALSAHFAGHGVTPDRNVIIHCQVGLASSHSYAALRLLGYPRVRVYHRSWAEWGADPALPTATGA